MSGVDAETKFYTKLGDVDLSIVLKAQYYDEDSVKICGLINKISSNSGCVFSKIVKLERI